MDPDWGRVRYGVQANYAGGLGMSMPVVTSSPRGRELNALWEGVQLPREM